MGTDSESTEIVETILTLAQKLGKKAIAEGVETEAQIETLKALGCGYGQGYLFSRPLWWGAAEKLITQPGSLDSDNEPVGGEVAVASEVYAM